MKQGYASIAGMSLKQTNTKQQELALNPAQLTFLKNSHGCKIRSIKYIGKQDVYNMEVKDHHNFSVNGGLIVHNSIDCARYALNYECMQFRDEQKKKDPNGYDERQQRGLEQMMGGELKIKL